MSRLAALLAMALLAATGAAHAADPCPDLARAIAELKPDDRFQEVEKLLAAARLGCEAEAASLIARGVSVDAKDRDGMTALARAAKAGKTKLMRLLIDAGADVGARAINGSTPLFFAAEADRAAAVRLLIERGADPNVPGRSGERPLAAAAYDGSADTVALLLAHGADPNALDDDGKGAMVYAAGRAYPAIVAALLAAGVDVNRRYGHGLTALMWAAGHDAGAGREDVEATLKTLLEHGADPGLRDDRGLTAAEIARRLGRDKEAAILDGGGTAAAARP